MAWHYQWQQYFLVYGWGKQYQRGPGTYGYAAVIHETLHALGLKHPGNYNAEGVGTDGPYLSSNEDNNTNTIMSYNNGGRGAGYNSLTPMAYDMRALQYLYGARDNNSSRTTYAFSNVYAYSVSGQTFGSTTTPVKQSIWDSGGVDTLDFSGLSSSSSYRFDLNQGGTITT